MKEWPETKYKLHVLVEPYFPYREEMTLQDGIIFCSERETVPAKIRGKVMETLHTPHLVASMLKRASEYLFGPTCLQESSRLQ